MRTTTRMGQLLAAGIIATAIAAGPSIASDRVHASESERNAWDVPAGNKMFLEGHATGVQIYRCGGSTDAGYAWGLVAPRATLIDERGRLLATHYGGPTWQARDGSTVVGARADGATVDADSIPWLLVKAVSWTSRPDGDRLSGTTFIQRINTSGGLPPAASTCTTSTVGAMEEIPYSADYTFWKQD